MGVIIPDPPEVVFATSTEIICCKVGCGRTITVNLVNEDAEMISYAGTCASCGVEYNLVHMKEES